MYKAVPTLSVALLLLTGAAANALTFKSDGSVVQNDGTVVQEASPFGSGNSKSSNRRLKTDDASIWENVRFAFIDSGGFENNAIGIDVTVNKGAVLLTGKVSTPESKVLATRLAWSALGVKEVINELQVYNTSSINDVAKDLAASAQLRGKLIADGGVSSLNFSIDVVNGTVYLSGIAENDRELQRVVGHARELRFAKQVVNYIQLKRDRDQDVFNSVNQSAALTANAVDGNSYRQSSEFKDKFETLKKFSDEVICRAATKRNKSNVSWDKSHRASVEVAQIRGLNCGVNDKGVTTSEASKAVAEKTYEQPSSAELEAAQKLASDLKRQLEKIEAQKKADAREISTDTEAPTIKITSLQTTGRSSRVRGVARDNVQVAEVLIDGQPVAFGSDGAFEWSGYVPMDGKRITLEVFDTASLSASQTITLERGQITQAAGPQFEELNPIAGGSVQPKQQALALIIGISDYKSIELPAIYADRDAQYFHDYAALKLGIPDQNIKSLVNSGADQAEILLGVRKWLRQNVVDGETDVFVFFAGHGLGTANGEAYLLPYDGRAELELLDRTALSQNAFFEEISAAKPRQVMVFLDACYSGKTREGEALLADAGFRPAVVQITDADLPSNFTVMTATSGVEFSSPLKPVKHGMFSYFLMKGMEGDADENADGAITAGELYTYVRKNVLKFSSDQQTPELQGDPDTVLVKFQ